MTNYLLQGTPPLWTIMVGQATILLLIVVCFGLLLHRMQANHLKKMQQSMYLTLESAEINRMIAEAISKTVVKTAEAVRAQVVDDAANVRSKVVSEAEDVRQRVTNAEEHAKTDIQEGAATMNRKLDKLLTPKKKA